MLKDALCDTLILQHRVLILHQIGGRDLEKKEGVALSIMWLKGKN